MEERWFATGTASAKVRAPQPRLLAVANRMDIMKFKADRATLMKALAHIQSVAEKRNTIPILANALIRARDGSLSFTATDMEIAIVEEVAASVSRDGATTAPAATLYEIVRSCRKARSWSSRWPARARR